MHFMCGLYFYTAESVLEQHKLMQGKSMLVKKLHSDLQSIIFCFCDKAI